MKKTIYTVTVVIFTMILCLSCERDFTPLPKEKSYLTPEVKDLVYQEDSVLIKKAIEYIDVLEFDLAKQEIKELKDKKVRDSIQSSIDEIENFADTYLLFTLNDLGKKEYVYGMERIQQYREKGYLDFKGESKTIDLDGDKVKNDVIAFFNFQAFPDVSRVELNTANAEYVDFGGLKKAEEFSLYEGKDNVTFDFSDIDNDLYVVIQKTSNMHLKISDKSKIALDLQNCRIKSLSEIGAKNMTLLALRPTKLADNKILKEENPHLTRFEVTFGGEPETDAEGITYFPPTFDDDFTESLKYAPNLESLDFNFTDFKSMNSFAFDKFKNISLDKLGKVSLFMREKLTGITKSDWRDEIVVQLPKCPNLKEIRIDGTEGSGFIYANTLDLSQLNTQNNPNLEKIIIAGYIKRIILPDNSNEKLKLHLGVKELNEVVIPEQAKGNINVVFTDFDDAFFAKDVNKDIELDWEYLRKNLKSVTGYINTIPPSKYVPYNKTETICFSTSRLDFSGEQWKDFKGLIYFKIGKSDNSRINIEYLDFGHLTIDNFEDNTIRVSKNCEVKNIPEGIVIKRRN